jgi:prophage antirepressor-like protein
MLAVFLFEEQEIRFVDGRPVAIDVAKVLGYKSPADTIRQKVDAEYKRVVRISTPGGMQSVVVLEEPGVYQLIFGSKVANAKKVQKWV